MGGEIGKMLMIAGAVVFVLGALVSGKLGPFGRLPGDILIERRNVTVYIPLATSLLLSVIVSVVVWLMRR